MGPSYGSGHRGRQGCATTPPGAAPGRGARAVLHPAQLSLSHPVKTRDTRAAALTARGVDPPDAPRRFNPSGIQT